MVSTSQVRHTFKYGINWFAIPCSSWIFMYRGLNLGQLFLSTHIDCNCNIDPIFKYIYIYTEIYGTPKLPRSRGSTRRHFLRPQGWSRFRSTKEGNRLARRLCYLPGPYYRILREHHLASLKLGSLLCCNFKILHIPS